MIKKVLVSSVVILVRRDLKMTAKKASVKISTGFPPEGCGNTPKKLEIVSNRIQNIGYRLIQKERLSSVKYKQSAVFTQQSLKFNKKGTLLNVSLSIAVWSRFRHVFL